MSMVCRKTGEEPEHLRLIYGGKELQEEKNGRGGLFFVFFFLISELGYGLSVGRMMGMRSTEKKKKK